jgi:HEAT repeat protein
MSLDGLSLYTPRRDLTFARYAFLLAKTGNQKEAIKNYQLVVDLFPNTTGWTISKRALQEKKALIEPTAARLTDLYLKVQMIPDEQGVVRKRYSDYRDEAVLALGGHRFPESFELLEKMANEAERNRELAGVTVSLAELGDKRALPLLHAIERENDQLAKIYAASALHEMGDDSWVGSFITFFGTQDTAFQLEWADELLRKACGGGPNERADWKTKPVEFARRWSEWIANQKDKTPAAAAR